MTAQEIIREYFPDIDDDIVNDIIKLFANDLSMYGEGATPEEQMRDTLRKTKEQYDSINEMVSNIVERLSEK